MRVRVSHPAQLNKSGETKMQDTYYHRKIFFKNGLGVSIVCKVRDFGGFISETYGAKNGLFEVAVLKGNEKDYILCYDTPITSDVLPRQDFADVAKIIERVKNLKLVTKTVYEENL